MARALIGHAALLLLTTTLYEYDYGVLRSTLQRVMAKTSAAGH